MSVMLTFSITDSRERTIAKISFRSREIVVGEGM